MIVLGVFKLFLQNNKCYIIHRDEKVMYYRKSDSQLTYSDKIQGASLQADSEFPQKTLI